MISIDRRVYDLTKSVRIWHSSSETNCATDKVIGEWKGMMQMNQNTTDSTQGKLAIGRWKWWMGLVAIAAFYFVMILLQIIPVTVLMLTGAEDQSKAMSEIMPFLTSLQFLILFLVALLIAHLIAKPVHKKDFGFYAKDLKSVVVPALVLALAYIAGVQIIERLLPELAKATIESAKQLGFGGGFGKDALLILNVCYLAPLVEEFYFRGLIFRSLRDGLAKHISPKIGLFIALVVSAAVFALAHGTGKLPLQKLELFVLAALMALALVRTGTLTTSILTHAINNCIALLLMLSLAGISVSLPAILLVLMAPILLWVLCRRIASE